MSQSLANRSVVVFPHRNTTDMVMVKPSITHKSEASTAIGIELLADYPDLLSVNDLCALTSLSAQTIRSEINNGHLPGCRIGRRLYVPKTRFLDYVENGGGIDA